MTQNKEVEIRVYDVVGSGHCISSYDGQRVHDSIERVLRGGKAVLVSFANVTHLTSAFLNAAIGQLYGGFSESRIKESLRVKDLVSSDLALLKRVVETAKRYFKDPGRFEKVRGEVLNGEDE